MTRAVLAAYGTAWAACAVALAGGVLVPGAAASIRAGLSLSLDGSGPHSLETVGILILHNAQVALWPLGLVAAGLPGVPGARVVFDAVVAGSLLANGAVVGLALAGYGPGLVPFLTHVPIEWLALALGAAGWLHHPRGGRRPTLRLILTVAVVLLTAAALLEVFGTPRTS